MRDKLSNHSSLAQTLNHLHNDANMVHGDVKLSNVKLRRDVESPWDAVTLLDFGYAQICRPGTFSQKPQRQQPNRVHTLLLIHEIVCNVQDPHYASFKHVTYLPVLASTVTQSGSL